MRAWFLNLGPPSEVTPEQAAADLQAIWATRPALLVGCEAVAKGPLPPAGEGNVLIRNTATPGRANLYAYIKGVTRGGQADPNRFRWGWDDCRLTFPRAQHPHLGPHPPRAILRFRYKGAQIVVAHQVPAWEGAGPARGEVQALLTGRMDPDQNPDLSRVLLWDSNGVEGAQKLARRVDGWVVGDGIDNAVVRKVHVIEHGYRREVNGHRFHTDHKRGAFYLRFKPVG